MAARSTLDPGILNFSCFKKSVNLESSDTFFLTKITRILHVTKYIFGGRSMEGAASCFFIMLLSPVPAGRNED